MYLSAYIELEKLQLPCIVRDFYYHYIFLMQYFLVHVKSKIITIIFIILYNYLIISRIKHCILKN
jgi:hypothetical protein